MNLRRRQFLGFLAGAASAVIAKPAFGTATSTVKTAVNFGVPPGSCECHVHVLDPARFAYSPRRPLTPPPATVDDLRQLLTALHLDRVVIVQPGPYGTNNSCILDAVRQIGASARAIALIDKTTSRSELEAMSAAGCRGIRLPFEVMRVTDPIAIRAAIEFAAEQTRGLNWHLHIYSRPTVIAQLKDQLAQLPVPVVIDHFGGAQAALGVDQPGFGAVIDLVRSGRAYVKLSGVNRISNRGPDFSDATPLAEAFVKANPDRVLWGSDWPHLTSYPGRPLTEISEPAPHDDGLVLNQLSRWVPDAAIRRKILVDNPARVYGFE